jgi:FMN-dependent NADH-azoreductase
MTTLLHLDSSPRGDRSQSRKLAKSFVELWRLHHPDATVTYRDLRHPQIPHVTEEWIGADFTPPDALTPEQVEVIKFSNELVDEFLAADCYVFSVPLYNFSIPSSFKAYIDQIVRVGRTFAFENGEFKGLVQHKKMLFITAGGVDYSAGSGYEGWDLQEPTLRYPFQFIGVEDIQFIHSRGLDLGDESRQQALSQAATQIQELAATW